MTSSGSSKSRCRIVGRQFGQTGDQLSGRVLVGESDDGRRRARPDVVTALKALSHRDRQFGIRPQVPRIPLGRLCYADGSKNWPTPHTEQLKVQNCIQIWGKAASATRNGRDGMMLLKNERRLHAAS
jgi:hypothetical protein